MLTRPSLQFGVCWFVCQTNMAESREERQASKAFWLLTLTAFSSRSCSHLLQCLIIWTHKYLKMVKKKKKQTVEQRLSVGASNSWTLNLALRSRWDQHPSVSMLFKQVSQESCHIMMGSVNSFSFFWSSKCGLFPEAGYWTRWLLVRHSVSLPRDLIYPLNEDVFLFASFSLNNDIYMLPWKCVYCKIFTATGLISLNSNLPEW